MFQALLYVDLFFLLWAWLYQWGCILKELYLQALVHAEGSMVVNSSFDFWQIPVFLGLPSSSQFWYITVFIGLAGILVTNVLGVIHYIQDRRFFLCALALVDWDTPYLVATEGQEYAKGGSPDIQVLRQRNALWRGLPCAAIQMFIAFRGVAQTSACMHITQLRMLSDPHLHEQFEQQLNLDGANVLPQLSHGKASENFNEFSLSVAASIETRFGEDECPAAQRQVQPVPTYKDYVSTVGILSSRKEDVRQFQDLSAYQVGTREYIAHILSKAISNSLPALAPFGFDPNKIDKILLDITNKVRGKGFQRRNAYVVTFSNPHTSFALLQALLQLLVAVRGLVKFVRQQRKLSITVSAALYVHVFLEALLTIGFLVLVFSVLPTLNALELWRETLLRSFDSIARGKAMDRLVRFATLAFWKDSQAAAYFDSDVFPLLEPTALRLSVRYFDMLKGAFAPDPALERDSLGRLLVIGGLLYGVLRMILAKVAPHVFVTSPVVVLDEEHVEPASVGLQMAVKTAAVLSPYVFAARTWQSFQVAVAFLFGFRVRCSVVYYASLGIYVAILVLSGFIAIIHYNKPNGGESGHGAELLAYPPPQQACCLADRKRHKYVPDTTAARAAEMEAGEGHGLLNELKPNYGCFQPANQWVPGAIEGQRGASPAR